MRSHLRWPFTWDAEILDQDSGETEAKFNCLAMSDYCLEGAKEE